MQQSMISNWILNRGAANIFEKIFWKALFFQPVLDSLYEDKKADRFFQKGFGNSPKIKSILCGCGYTRFACYSLKLRFYKERTDKIGSGKQGESFSVQYAGQGIAGGDRFI